MKSRLRHIALVALVGLMSTSAVYADGLQCRHGIAWTISQSKAWGAGKPVITRIQPNSSSAKAGLRVGDIIERLDGYNTERLSPAQIQALLESKNDLHTLRISRLGKPESKYILGYQCKPCGSLSERELAELFSLYSIEDASEEKIIYPYSYTQSPNYPLGHIRYFALAPSHGRTAETDKLINDEASLVLGEKGLQLKPDADLVLSSYYELSPLANAKEGDDAIFSWRYDRRSNSLKPFPLYGYNHVGVEEAKYKLTLGLQLQSRESKKVVWSCEAKEYLSDAMSIGEYAQSAIATMLTGFPYVAYNHSPTLKVHSLRYNYTGLIYSAKRMNLIVDVEDNSPAMRAGLRPGDLIRSINGIRLTPGDSDSILEDYFKTAERLERYRDKDLPALKALVADIPLSYWRVSSYDSIASTLRSGGSSTAFAYLFGFRPYVSERSDKSVIYEIEREGQVYFVPVAPEYRDETTIGI